MILRFFILWAAFLLCAGGCNVNDVAESSMVMRLEQSDLTMFEGVEVSAMVGNVVIGRDSKLHFFTPQLGYVPTGHSAKKIYNLADHRYYLLIDQNNQLHFLEFTEGGICTTTSVLPELYFENASVARRAGTVHVLAVETTGRVWRIRQLHSGDLATEQVQGLQGITEAIDSILSVALDVDGRVWAWGLDFVRAPEHDEYAGTLIEMPSVVAELPPIKKITGNASTLLALSENGELWVKGMDYFGLLATRADRYRAENAGPGQVWYYPLFEWTKAASSIRDVYVVSSDCLCLVSDSDVAYYRNDVIGPRLALLEDRPDANSAILESRRGHAAGCFFSQEQLPSDARMFYDSEQIVRTIKQEGWLDYWSDRTAQAILFKDGRVECFSKQSSVGVAINDAEGWELHINAYAIPQSCFVSCGDRLWVIPFPE